MTFDTEHRSAVTKFLVEHYYACKTINPDVHHLHLDCVLTNVLEKTYTGAPNYVPHVKSLVMCETEKGAPVLDPIPIAFNATDLQDFYDEAEDLLTQCQCTFHVQFSPRLVMILEPSPYFPFKVELVPLQMSVNDIANVVTGRKNLIDLLHFKTSAFGSRVHLFVTPQNGTEFTPVGQTYSTATQNPVSEPEKPASTETTEPVKTEVKPTLQPQSGQEVFKYSPPPKSGRPSLDELMRQTEAYVKSVQNTTPPEMPTNATDQYSVSQQLTEELDKKSRQEFDEVRAIMQRELDKIDLLTGRDSRPLNTPSVDEGGSSDPLKNELREINPLENQGQNPADQSILQPIVFSESEVDQITQQDLVGDDFDNSPIPEPKSK